MAEPSEDRIEQVGERIDEARRKAHDDGLLSDDEPDPMLDDVASQPAGDEGGPTGDWVPTP